MRSTWPAQLFVKLWPFRTSMPESKSQKSVLVDRLSSACPTPNLFLLGAGKCGTTSLHNILAQHPNIHASPVKEPSFFCSYFQVVQNPIDYLTLFNSRARYRLDSSHVYLSNPETPPVLRALFPDAKFILIFRDPKQRAYSLYRHMRRVLHSDRQPLEEIADFASALRAEPERYASPDFCRNCRHYFWNFMYCRSSLYDEQLARYFALFDRDRFHVLSLAELAAGPAPATARIIEFLGLDRQPLRQFAFAIANYGGPFTPYDSECDRLMDEAFAGLTVRTNRLVGRPLDWSL